jgi:hypothetical protein
VTLETIDEIHASLSTLVQQIIERLQRGESLAQPLEIATPESRQRSGEMVGVAAAAAACRIEAPPQRRQSAGRTVRVSRK